MLPADQGAAPRAEGPRPASGARRFRCERCFDVVSTRHPWDVMACCCGELVVSGVPWDPAVRWSSGPGGGWTEVVEQADEEPHGADDTAAAPRLGYLR